MANAKKEKKSFKKGDSVKWLMNTHFGVSKGKGKVTKILPGGERAGARLQVTTADGKVVKPYPSQCSAA